MACRLKPKKNHFFGVKEPERQELMDKNTDLMIGERRGVPVYKANPTLVGMRGNSRDKPARVIKGNKAMITDEFTGEITGEGAVAFLETEEVDTDRFVKLYLAGLDGMFNLTKSGQTVFKLLWMQVQAKKDSDRVELNVYIAEDYGLKVTPRMMTRGIKELLEKEFLFNTPTSGLYFFNAKYMFNGNRIVTAKQYVLQGTHSQQSLQFEAPPEEEKNLGSPDGE